MECLVKAIHCWFKVLIHSLGLSANIPPVMRIWKVVTNFPPGMCIWKVVTKFPPGMLIWKALPLELKHGVLDRKTAHGTWFFLLLHWWQPRTIESLTPWPGLLGVSWIFVCCPFLSPLLGPLTKPWCRMDSTWWAFSAPALTTPWT